MFRVCCYILVFVAGGSQTCLPGAIPEGQRSNISQNGLSMPIGIASGDWQFNLILTDMMEILLKEALGYNVARVVTGSGLFKLLYVAGCRLEAPITCSLPSFHHITLEVMVAHTALTEWITAMEQLGDEAPVDLGSMGYEGTEGLFVFQEPRTKYLADTGLDLSYFFSYNASWFHPENYLATVDEVNMSQLRPCAESLHVEWPGLAQQYLSVTGDLDGIEYRNGQAHLICWRDTWWLAPACRSNASNCIAVVTGPEAWGKPYMVQQAAFHNMPLALASAVSTSAYQQITLQLKSLFYWWTPDPSFAAFQTSKVVFPQHNAAEYREGVYKTQPNSEPMRKLVSSGLATAASRANGLVANFYFLESDVSDLLALHVQSGSNPWHTACTWLKSHGDQWAGWIPAKTDCTAGKGLVDESGMFVSARANAADCATCPPGRASLKWNNTFLCASCPVGSFQNSWGATECSLCGTGAIAAERGATQCSPCTLGQFANGTGMSFCFNCTMESGQRELWTTSQEVIWETGSQIMQFQGATSSSFCSCTVGSFLKEGRCLACPVGTHCPGSNRLELLPGYFSSPDTPDDVYLCEESFCPGGPPGTCAENRDAESVACTLCLGGHRQQRDGSCQPCSDSDYMLLVLLAAGIVAGVAALYVSLLQEEQAQQNRHVLVIVCGFSQFLAMLQMLAVIKRFDISWGEPFASFLIYSDILSLDFEMVSFTCVTMGPVETFALRALTMPAMVVVASMVYAAHKLTAFLLNGAAGANRVSARYLLRTVGSLFLMFFIILFSMLLAPFKCRAHPNGRFTVQGYGSVLCNGHGQHMQLFLLGGLACVMPLLFLSVCIWLVLVELPRRLTRSDTNFVRTCSFLIVRFRPGAEVFAVVLLIRNAMVVLCPIVSTNSTKLLMMSLVLYANQLLVALFRPWRFALCNFLDMVIVLGMLVILDMGSVTVRDSDHRATTAVVVIFLSAMFAAAFGTFFWAISRFFWLKIRKRFKFFLCHHKQGAGSMARLLKMELEVRLPGTRTFIDCDDLSDLTRLFSYVSQDTETFVILGSPQIFTRKWCIGEMVSARQSRVRTLLLAWPDMVAPDAVLIENYCSIVPDIGELVKFGISLADVQATLQFLSSVETLTLPGQLIHNIDQLIDSFTGIPHSKISRFSSKDTGSDFPILVDPGNLEAVASAMALSALLKPLLLGTHLPIPSVLSQDFEIAQSAKMSLMLCSESCFKSEHVRTWLLQAYHAASCCMIPVIVQSLQVPTASYVSSEFPVSAMDIEELHLYGVIIRALFQDIALIFLPQSFNREDLDLRAQQAARRLTAPQQTLKDKVVRLIESFHTPTLKLVA